MLDVRFRTNDYKIMARHNDLGHAGEQFACEMLIAKGMVIRELNWRLNHLEIDIVAWEEGARVLHIVEVKTRTANDAFDFTQAITAHKRRLLINAANGYVRHYNLNVDVQFDVVIVQVNANGEMSLDYYPNAFDVPLHCYH